MTGVKDARMLNVAQVAEIFNVKPQTVRRWAEQGRLKHIHTPGKGLRIPQDEVKRFLDNHFSETAIGERFNTR